MDQIEENPLRLLMQLNSDARLPMMRNKARRWMKMLQQQEKQQQQKNITSPKIDRLHDQTPHTHIYNRHSVELWCRALCSDNIYVCVCTSKPHIVTRVHVLRADNTFRT